MARHHAKAARTAGLRSVRLATAAQESQKPRPRSGATSGTRTEVAEAGVDGLAATALRSLFACEVDGGLELLLGLLVDGQLDAGTGGAGVDCPTRSAIG
jgi:hypothetical protein